MNINVTARRVSAAGRDVGAFMSGCNAPRMEVHAINNFLKLEVGMSEEEVLAILGRPRSLEGYASLCREPVAIWYYDTEGKRAGDNVTNDEMTPVLFRSGRLVGWDSDSYELKGVNYARL